MHDTGGTYNAIPAHVLMLRDYCSIGINRRASPHAVKPQQLQPRSRSDQDDIARWIEREAVDQLG